jgi:polysaccharide export outer membrane protein
VMMLYQYPLLSLACYQQAGLASGYSRRVKKLPAAEGAEMTRMPQRYCIRIVTGCLISIGIAAVLGTAVCASGAQEKQEPPVLATTGPATSDTATGGEEAGRPVLQRRNPRYQLCKGDTFDLTFPFTPEFNQTVTVHPDGYITLTGLGDLYVAEKTIPELRQLLRTAYEKILHDPVINVVLKDFEKPFFIAGGQVAHPGKYDLRDDTTLTEAIAIAGGFTENSKHSQVLLFRRVSSDWAEARILNVKKMFQAGNLTEDVHLQPGDMFFVPQNTISKIRKFIPYTAVNAGVNPTHF